MASEEGISSVGLDSSTTANIKNFDNSGINAHDNMAGSSPDLSNPRQYQYGNKSDKERKIGHRRVGEGGEITYKKIQTTQIMGSIQLGIQHTVGSLASKPKRDLLMMDFWEIESITFPPEGSTLTPAHHYSEFRYKIYAPIAFRYFRDLFGIQPDDFMMSMCSSPLRELSNPGASGSIFYLTNDDEFIIKTVQHKEGEFLQKLLPGYYMNLNQNPRTLLPKFFGLYCLQTNNSKNIRLVVMNNLLPSYVNMHLKYDLKGSTFKRKASKVERSKKSPTYKDLDFMEHHPNGILLEAETYNALIKTIQRDCTVLESFKIMDYSLLVGVHNLDLSNNEKGTEVRKKTKSCNQLPRSYECDLEDSPEADQYVVGGRDREITIWNRNRSVNRHRLVAHSTAMESIQAESEPIDDEEDVPPGGIPARSEKGERLLLFVGIIDILQSYRLKKKLEHTFKSIIHDGDTVSVCRPSFYAQRFQNFMAKTVFRKIPSLDLPEIKGNHRKFRTLVSSYIALKHSPSKRKSLSKAIQRSVENDLEYRNPNTSQILHASCSHNNKVSIQSKPSSKGHAASSLTSSSVQNISKTSPAVKQISLLGSAVCTNSKVPPPVPPRTSPRIKKAIRVLDKGKHQSHRTSHSSGTYSESENGEIFPLKSSLQVPKSSIPRFGEQRSPSNVRDWLEIHDLFNIDEDELNSTSTQRLPKAKASSVATTGSVWSVRSRNRSKIYLPSVDLFHRQNSFMSHRAPSSIVSIVRHFPPDSTKTKTIVESHQRQQKQRGTALSCSSTPPPAFDDISEDKSNKTSNSSIEHKLHPHCEPKMYLGPGFRRSPMHETLSVSEIHLDTYLAIDTSYSNECGSRGGLAWTPPASGEGSTPTWTEGTPSFTDSSSSEDFEIFPRHNASKVDRYKPTVEDAINSLTSEVVH